MELLFDDSFVLLSRLERNFPIFPPGNAQLVDTTACTLYNGESSIESPVSSFAVSPRYECTVKQKQAFRSANMPMSVAVTCVL